MSVSLKLTYDATVDVAYLTLRPTGPADVLGPTLLLEHDRAFAGAVAMDFGLIDGRVVGFEFQMASSCLPAELSAAAERSDGRSVSDRLGERILRGLRDDIAMGARPDAHRRSDTSIQRALAGR